MFTAFAVLAKAAAFNRKRKQLKLTALVTTVPLTSGSQTFEGSSHEQIPHLLRIACFRGKQEFTIWRTSGGRRSSSKFKPNHVELSAQMGRNLSVPNVERFPHRTLNWTEPVKLNGLNRASKSFRTVSIPSAASAEVRMITFSPPQRRGPTSFRRKRWQLFQRTTVRKLNLSRPPVTTTFGRRAPSVKLRNFSSS
ncbi:MAG: hypothetical protein ACTS5F_01565 [Candidatus Hodgkinia cicadicola]